MPSYVDLHLHTNCSDGSDSPQRVVERAAAWGLSAIAITDHDTVSGLAEAEKHARSRKIEFLPGTEISARLGEIETHIVGLGIDPACEALVDELNLLHEARSARVDAIIAKLNGLGIPLERGEVEAQAAPGSTLGRVHVARALKANGVIRYTQEGFDRFLRAGRRAHVANKMLSCRHAIDLIHEAGGVAVLAHPGVSPNTMKVLARLLELPFDGIEVYHTKHTPGQMTQFIQLALERDLLISGGSDCHGTATKSEPDMGKLYVPYQHFERIQDAIRNAKR